MMFKTQKAIYFEDLSVMCISVLPPFSTGFIFLRLEQSELNETGYLALMCKRSPILLLLIAGGVRYDNFRC